MHGLIVLDLTNGNKPVEVSRLKLNDGYFSHWTGWDAKTGRLVVTGNQARLYLVKLDQSSGALTMDTAFHDRTGSLASTLPIASGPMVGKARESLTE